MAAGNMEKLVITDSEMISCENVKPSSPTPPDLQTYKFSMFDQKSESTVVPLVLYFASTGDDTTSDHHRKTEKLRTSLSLTLTQFYPVAGRVSADGLSIDCKDQGVPFMVENIKGHQLSELLKTSPDPALWARLFPCELGPDVEWGAGSNVAMIKVTHFKCEGVAIALAFSHKVFDAVSIACFLKYWSATARGLPSTELPPGPNYVLPSLFPPKEELLESSGPTAEIREKEKFVSRRYVFDGPAIKKLKAMSSSNAVGSPTRVEVVTALLWKCYMIASLANHEKPVAFALTHAVNLRRRTRPPLPSECFGSMTTYAVASYNNSNYDHDNELLRHLVTEIRRATSKIDDEYVKRLHSDEGEGESGSCEDTKLIWSGYPEAPDLLCFTSWCGMGFYDVNFGHGKPVWMTATDGSERTYDQNVVVLMDTKLGDGVEAWVILKKKYMNVFEKLEEVQNHASTTSL